MKGGPNSITDSDGNVLYWDSLKGEWLPKDQLSPEVAIESEPDYEYLSEPDPFAGEAREAMGVDGY